MNLARGSVLALHERYCMNFSTTMGETIEVVTGMRIMDVVGIPLPV